MTVKNWTFAYNTAPENQTTAQLQAASLHKQRKDFLVAGGWTVTRSCNPTDGVVTGDCLTDLTDYVWSASGDRSWMELKSPEGFYPGLDGTYTGDQSRAWLTVHLNSANVYMAEIYLHNTVPTGTASTAACPTTSTKIGYTAQQMLRSAFVGNAIFHFARTSQGSWFEHVGYSAAGMCPWYFISFPLCELNYNDSTNKEYPFAAAVWCRFRDAAGGATADNGPASQGYSGGMLYDANVKLFYHDGTAATGTPEVFSSYGNAFTGSGFSSTTRDTFNYSYPASPVLIRINTPGKCQVGKVADIAFSAAPFNQGDVDSAANPARVLLGNYLFPTNTTVTL